MAAHKQYKSSNPQQTESDLETHRYILSMDDKTSAHIIDRQTIDIDSKRPRSGLQRYLSRQDKSAKLILETLTGSI